MTALDTGTEDLLAEVDDRVAVITMNRHSRRNAFSNDIVEALGPVLARALATPDEVADYFHTTTASLAQDRYRGTGPKFIKRGSRMLYRRRDVSEWLDRNTFNAMTS